MRVRRVLAVAAGVAIAAGSGAAIAATTAGDAEKSILADAAKRLNVSPEELKSALSAAEQAQLDEQVKKGELSQEEADRIKQRREKDGNPVLGLGHDRGPGDDGPGFRGHVGGRGFGFGGPGFFAGPGGGVISAVTKELGLSEKQVLERLRNGKTLKQIAEAQGKTLADLKRVAKAAAKQQLDQRVKDGDLKQSEADDILERIDEAIDRFATSKPPGFRGRGGFGHP